MPFAVAKDAHVSPGCAWAYLAQREEMPDWTGEGRANAVLAGVGVGGELLMVGARGVAEIVEMMVERMVERDVGMAMAMVLVGAESMVEMRVDRTVDMVVVVLVELQLLGADVAPEATQ